jgi:hypothetical protein
LGEKPLPEHDFGQIVNPPNPEEAVDKNPHPSHISDILSHDPLYRIQYFSQNVENITKIVKKNLKIFDKIDSSRRETQIARILTNYTMK